MAFSASSASPNPAVTKLIADLNPRIIAIQTQTTEVVAHAVLQELMTRVEKHVRDRRALGVQDHFRLTTEALLNVVQEVDVRKLTGIVGVMEEDVAKILVVVGRIAESAEASLQPPWQRRSFFAPVQAATQSSEIQWPTSIPEHAFKLHLAFDTVKSAGNGTAVVIAEQDLCALQYSMRLLEHKISCAYGEVLDEMTPEARPVFAREEWYVSRRTDGREAGSRKTGDAPVDGVRVREAVDTPHIQIPQPQPLLSSKNNFLPLPPPTSKSTSITSYSGATPSHLSQAVKHSLTPSTSTNPSKKKPKIEPKVTLLRREREKAKEKEAAGKKAAAKSKENGGYRIFIRFERDRLEKDLAEDVSGLKGGVSGHELNLIISQIWSCMSSADKAPYMTAYEAVPSTLYQETADRERVAKLEDTPRCETLRNAKKLCEELRAKAANAAFERVHVGKGTIEKLWGKDGKAAAILSAQRASSSSNGTVALPGIHEAPSSIDAPIPLSRTSGNRQSASFFVPQPQPPQLQPQRLPSDTDFLAKMKSLNAELYRNMSKSRLVSRAATPSQVVDLTWENEPSVVGRNRK